MRPVLFACFGIRVRSFPVMLYIGLVVGVFAGVLPARVRGIAPGDFVVAATAIIAAGLIGARLWFVATQWRVYWAGGQRLWGRSGGGLALWGGIFFGILISIVLLRIMSLPFDEFWDAGAIGAMAGVGVGRIGCLLNGCCAGRETAGRLGWCLPNRRGEWRRRVPTQVLEMLLCLALAGGAAAALDRTPHPGTLFLAVLAGLGAGRFILEGQRERSSAVSRIASALLAFGCSGAALATLLS